MKKLFHIPIFILICLEYFTSYTILPDDFETNPVTGLLEANLPISQFNPALTLDGAQAVAIINLTPGGVNLTVVSLSFVGVDADCTDAPKLPDFVWKRESTLMLGNRPFRFISFNLPIFWNLDPWEVEDALRTVAIFANGSSAVIRTAPIIQIGENYTMNQMGFLNDDWFFAVERAVLMARDFNVKLVIPLINQTDGSGEYFGGGIPAFNALMPNPNSDFNSFFTDPATISAFKSSLNVFLERFKNESSIMAWELGNGLKPSNALFPPTAWLSEVSSFIKQVDPNHLIFDGSYNDGKCRILLTFLVVSSITQT